MNEHHDGMFDNIQRIIFRIIQKIEHLSHRIDNDENMDQADRNLFNYRLAQLEYSLQHAEQMLNDVVRDILGRQILDMMREILRVQIDENQPEGQQDRQQ